MWSIRLKLTVNPSKDPTSQVLSRFDTDSSGDLSFEEYLALMAVWVEEDETQIIEAFKVGIFLGRFIEDLADLSNK